MPMSMYNNGKNYTCVHFKFHIFYSKLEGKRFWTESLSSSNPEYCKDYLMRLPLFSVQGPKYNTRDVQIAAEQDNWSLLNPVLDHKNILLYLIKTMPSRSMGWKCIAIRLVSSALHLDRSLASRSGGFNPEGWSPRTHTDIKESLSHSYPARDVAQANYCPCWKSKPGVTARTLVTMSYFPLIYSDDATSRIPRNVGTFLLDHRASHSRRQLIS
jgi:hypothetical protein